MKTQIVIYAALIALAGCSRADEGGGDKTSMIEDKANMAAPPEPARAHPVGKTKPSELDRLLREGAQEKGQGLGRFDRKRGE